MASHDDAAPGRAPDSRALLPLWCAVAAACMALCVVTFDTILAQLIGIIREGMPFDGVGYAAAGESLERMFSSGGFNAWFPHGMAYELTLAPLWKLLIAAHLGALGNDVWQAYSVRVWPVFVLLFLTLWIAWRHGGVGFAFFMAAVAVTLPIVSPNATSVLATRITGSENPSMSYLGDIRPDMLYAALLVFAIALLIESADHPTTALVLADGAIAAASVLVKSSTGPLTLCAWGAALLYFGWRRRADRGQLWRWYGWAVGVFLAIVLPWGFAGSFQMTWAYLRYNALGPMGAALWGLPNASLAQLMSFYWVWFLNQMGIAVAVLLAVLVLWHLLWPRTLVPTSSWPSVFMYGGLAVVLYAIVTVEVDKNDFLGLPAYFLAWVILLILAAGVWRRLVNIVRVPSVIIGISALVLVFTMLAYSASVTRASTRPTHWRNLILVRHLAHDMRSFLSDNDKYTIYNTAEFPGIVNFYMMDGQGRYPATANYDDAWNEYLVNPTQATRARFISVVLAPSKVIVMFDDSIRSAKQTIYVRPGGTRILELIRAYLADPHHGMCSYKRYRFERLPGNDDMGGLTVTLYVRCAALGGR